MKRLFLVALAAGTLILAACSNLTDVNSTSSKGSLRSGSDQTLTLSLTDESLQIARTIYPGDWSDWDQDYADDDLAKNVNYVLTGYTVDAVDSTTKGADSAEFKNSADKTLSYEVFDYADLMKSAAKVSIKPLIWYFTLTAYASAITNEDGVVSNTDACLVGTAWADMTTGSKTIVFKMKPAPKGTTAVGTAEMGLTFTPPDTFEKVTYGFYEESDTTPGTPDFASPASDATTTSTTVVTLQKVAKATPTTAGDDAFVLSTDATEENALISSAKSKNEVAGYSYTYTLKAEDGNGDLQPLISNQLTAGTYWFKAEFYDNQNKRLAVYIEKYVIDGTNTSTGDIELLEMAFNSAPKNIEDLTLTYNFNDIEFTSAPGVAAHQLFKSGDTVQSTYTATLKWTDEADNEAGYEIWLKKFAKGDEIGNDDPEDVILSPTTAPATLTAYGTAAAKLQAGLTECTLTLDTGVRYQISVRAYNDWSKAQDSYDDSYDTTAKSQGYDRFVPYLPREDADPAADNKTFGLYTIDYNLNGGAVKQTSAKKTASTVLHYVVPYIYMEDNVLVGENDTAETFPYILRKGYTFVGWNELYGATGWAISNTTKKYYYTNPGLTTKVSDTSSPAFTSTGTFDTESGATLVLDSIVMDYSNDPASKVDAPTGTNMGGTGTAGSPNYLATYSWTIPVWYSDGKFYKEQALTNEVSVPENAVVSPARSELSDGDKCTYSNVMMAEGKLTNTDYLNREVFASWETPLSFGIKLPRYADFKLTKQAAAGDPLEYSLGETVEINVVNSHLSDVTFTVYADDGTTAAETLFAEGSDAIKTAGITVADGDFTWVTKDTNDPASYTYAAMTYYIKITATYTYESDSTNSLSGDTDTVEGYIYIRLTN